MRNPLLDPLRQLIVEEHCLPLSEHRLLGLLVERGVLSGDYNAHPLGLFRAHFLVMNGLYSLREQLRARGGAQLCISPLSIELTAREGRASSDLAVTAVDDLCRYYLDWAHFKAASNESVEQLLDHFWRRYIGRRELAEALAIMQLDWPVRMSGVKARYRTLAMEWHPDRGGDPRQFAQLQSAYADLKRYLGKDS